jgi:chemotaxis protein MotB
VYTIGRSRRARSINIWPGFVDALATLLLVVIFVLMVFVIAQHFLSVALTGKDKRLAELDEQLSELADLLALERSANAELRVDFAQLSAELQSSIAGSEALASQLSETAAAREDLASQLARIMAERDDLSGKLAAAGGGRDDLIAQLAAMAAAREDLLARLGDSEEARRLLEEGLDASALERAALQARLAEVEEDLNIAFKTIDVDREKLEVQLAELAILKDLRDQLEREMAALEGAYALIKKKAAEGELEMARLQQTRDDLLARLAAQALEVDDLARRASSAEDTAEQHKVLSEQAERKVNLLNRQIAALRRQLATLNAALEASETLNEEQEVQIADLGRRLNVALASKVQELARYRSEFFGRLRELLGDNPNIEIVGDRFVFQAEVLFPSGSAVLQPNGRAQIEQLASLLQDLETRIPEDIDWVLRVDGHTDKQPINTLTFPSNWELSSARAISVVKFMIASGISPARLVAAGFGEFRPIAEGDDLATLARNRRIEFKLTER